jgi:hypothetical protein
MLHTDCWLSMIRTKIHAYMHLKKLNRWQSTWLTNTNHLFRMARFLISAFHGTIFVITATIKRRKHKQTTRTWDSTF